MSLEMATSSLRKFSACSAFLDDEVEALDLGQAVDQRADLGPEQLVDLGPRDGGVLDHVVQQRRDDGRVVELQVGEDGGDFERMGEIGFAGGALLVAVRLHGIDVGAIEQRLVRLGIVAENPLDELVLPHHGPPLLGRAAAESTAAPAYWRARLVIAQRPRSRSRSRGAAVGAAVGRRLGRRHALEAAQQLLLGHHVDDACRSTGRRGRARASGARAAAAAPRRLPARRPRRSSGWNGSAPRACPRAGWSARRSRAAR